MKLTNRVGPANKLETPAAEILNIKADRTMKDGEAVYERKEGT